ncbi:MAG: hypothetical protein KY451_12440 [Actinobacteria bacterium]|nr:hypothetical protein [Actinomycetota bacterium]MBW3647426.1 hypothetical protein [Actinomycetota bacterium]
MTEPNDDAAADADRPTGAVRPIESEPDEPVPVEVVPEGQRETEQTIRSISRLEESN